jgi:hypothetical protein
MRHALLVGRLYINHLSGIQTQRVQRLLDEAGDGGMIQQLLAASPPAPAPRPQPQPQPQPHPHPDTMPEVRDSSFDRAGGLCVHTYTLHSKLVCVAHGGSSYVSSQRGVPARSDDADRHVPMRGNEDSHFPWHRARLEHWFGLAVRWHGTS